jgi:preprotein translocase subunit SecG
MNWTNIAIGALLVCFVIDCALMCVVILMQRSKQEGLGAAFGGGMMDSAFGAQTSQVLVKTTVVLAALFFVISISLARLYSIKASAQPHVSTIDQALSLPVPMTSTNAAGTPVVPTSTPMTPAPAASNAAPATPAPSAAPTPAEPAKPAAK